MSRRPVHALVELARAHAFVSAAVDRELVALGIEPFHLGVLEMVLSFGPVTPTELERQAGIRPTTLREAVQSLVALGYVSRSENPHDRRSHWLEATDEGRARHAEGMRAVRRVERGLEARLGLPLADLRRDLRALREAAQDVHAEAGR